MAHVLVAETDTTVRELLCGVLTDEGHVVAQATNGHAVLDLLRLTPHHWVVLLAYRMPGVDGPGVLQAVAADAFLPVQHAYNAITAAPILDAPVAVLRTALGVPLLAKPFGVDDVLSAVAQAAARLGRAQLAICQQQVAQSWELSAQSRRLLRRTRLRLVRRSPLLADTRACA